jgi:dipeptidyl aminopeptidase/acylaminoacyl peptidase
MKRFLIFPVLAVFWSGPLCAQGTRTDYMRALALPETLGDKLFRTNVRLNWLPEGKQCWYRVETAPGQHEIVLVDVAAGTRQVLGDLSALPAVVPVKTSSLPMIIRPTRRTGSACQLMLVNHAGTEVELFWQDREGESISYGKIAPGTQKDLATYEGHQWVVKDSSGTPLAGFAAGAGVMNLEIDGPSRGEDAEDHEGPPPGRGPVSPDGKWRIECRDHNLFLKAGESGPAEALTTDGTAENAYQEDVAWSPDSASLVATRVVPGQEHPVHMVESSPKDQLQPKLFTHNYLKPGDVLPKPRPVLIKLEDRSVKLIDEALFPVFFTEDGHLQYRWQPDSLSFTFTYNQRGHQVFRLISVDRESGLARALVDEKAETFIDWTQKTWHRFLDATHELIWMSERDGWCHLYLIDALSGQVKNQITTGAWVVRKVESVDEKARQIWFFASGQRPGEDPYHLHFFRVNFDGSGLVRLTEGDGNHKVSFSPDRQWLVDVWSRVDLPEVTELRRASDGQRVLELERGDASRLVAGIWQMPERFTAKGRDLVTDIYGTIIKPSNFDPMKNYPVLEEVYAGPQGSFVARDFTLGLRQHAFAELGFIVVQADGMGTNDRGKAFHKVCWKNLADAGFLDRIAWMKAAAAARPWMDLKRVGIFGGSAGGQNAMRALIDYGDFYSAAAADCGCHDNRMDKIWWNEQWMGWPVDASYGQSSNVVHAHRMSGNLLLSVGEMDSNVDPASTMQVVDALEKANKDFELLIVPGSNHGAGERPYAARRRMDFFVRHLMGYTPRWTP